MDRPTLTTLALFAAVFAVQAIGNAVGIGAEAFALAVPLEDRPWTIVASVYAHGSLAHLVANAFALAIVGPLVARVTTPLRFHTFFAGVGALAGIAEITLASPFGGVAVLGASGAVFGLLGYLLIGNRASEAVLSWLPLGRRGRLLLFAVLAALLTVATAAPGVALVAHFAGFCFGAVAGRGRLLHAQRGDVARRQ